MAFEWLPFRKSADGKIGARVSDMHLCRLYKRSNGWQIFIDFTGTTDVLRGRYSLAEAKRTALKRVRDDFIEDIDARREEVEASPESYIDNAEEFINYPLKQIAMIDEALARDDLQSPIEKLWYRN